MLIFVGKVFIWFFCIAFDSSCSQFVMIYIWRKEMSLFCIQKDFAACTILVIFWVIISSVKNPRPQSGAKTSLSLSMYFNASSTLFFMSSTVSILDLATVTTPRIMVDFLNCGNRLVKSLHASASSIEN